MGNTKRDSALNLERSKQGALELLSKHASTGLSLTANIHSRMWLGVGFAVARGWAVYICNDTYRITEKGKEELAELKKFDAAE
jgi:hypothetical protein